MGAARAGRDALLGRPEHGVVIVGVRGNVRERIIAAFGFRAACGAPQEGDDLTARAALIGTEFSCGGAARDPVFDRPENRLVEIRALGNVGEAEVILRRIAVERKSTEVELLGSMLLS